jgi:hypothetical protein
MMMMMVVVVASRPIGGEQVDKASELRFCCCKKPPVLGWSSVRRLSDPLRAGSDDPIASPI